MTIEKKPILVAVYGSLRAGLHNHQVLGDSKLLGEFDTQPIYGMYSCGGFPGLVLHGSTSIKMEVYEVTPEINRAVERLESYVEGREESNHYNKVTIPTPYGDAGTYIYNYSVSRLPQVESGDWKTWKENLRKQLTSII